MNTAHVREQLKSMPFLEGVTETSIHQLARLVTPVSYETDQVLFEEGDPREFAALIVSGAGKNDLDQIRTWALDLDKRVLDTQSETKVIPIENATVQEIISALNTRYMQRRAGSKQQQDVFASQIGSNNLLLQAPRERLPEIEQFVATLDGAVTPQENMPVTIELKFVDANTMRDLINAFFGQGRTGPRGAGAQQVQVSTSGSTTLVVRAPAKEMKQIQELIKSLDEQDPASDMDVKTYQLKVLNATEVALLANLLVGSVPGVLLGSWLCGWLPQRPLRLAIAALLGAEEFGFATTALVSMGCILMRVCHQDTCPVGIATQNPELRRKFAGKPEHVVRFMRFVAQELREHMAALGFRTVDEMVGRSDLLDMQPALDHWKAKGLNFSRIFERPQPRRPGVAVRKVQEQDHGIATVLDQRLIAWAREAHTRNEPLRLDLPILNTDRATGTMLGSEVTRRHPQGLPDGRLHVKFTGSAGQSFGAFIPRGITLELEGDANDYLGKGLSGGRIVVYPPKASRFKAEENILIGNVAAYGATGGELFVRGVAGERFCVRNGGVQAIVEGVGDHGCEYMTGGRVVVIGHTGRNFAAGMSGGIAYVLDERNDFEIRCNLEMVGLEELASEEDVRLVRDLLVRHLQLTGSTVAERILEHWEVYQPRFVKVLPHEYKRALEQLRQGTPQPAVAG